MPKILKKDFEKYTNRRKLRIYLDLSSITQTDEEELNNNSISFELSKKDFSFKQKMGKSESIKNPNILEKTKLENEKISAIDKFNETEDPIYSLDELPPIISKYSQQQEKTESRKILRDIKKTKSYKSKMSKTYVR